MLDAAASVFCREGFAGANIDLIAAEAGVSRQTIYNHHKDKESLLAAVVSEISGRCNARAFAVLDTFPDRPQDLQADLTAFAIRFNRNCICDRDGQFLRKLLQSEAQRHPQLFSEWRKEGPSRIWAALAARLARLAHAGWLELDDPDLAARQFLALINADLQMHLILGEQPTGAELETASANAIRTFLRAYARRT